MGRKSPLQQYAKYAGVGFELLACLLLFIGGGYLLDKWFHTSGPWFLIALSILGILAAILLMIRRFGQLDKSDED